jgi:hypothetical protein
MDRLHEQKTSEGDSRLQEEIRRMMTLALEGARWEVRKASNPALASRRRQHARFAG